MGVNPQVHGCLILPDDQNIFGASFLTAHVASGKLP